MSNGMVQQKTGGASTDFEIVTVGATGDVPLQQADGSFVMGTSSSPATQVWKFNSSTGGGDPSSNKWSMNNADPALATKLYLSKIAEKDQDIGAFMDATVDIGDAWYVQDQADSTLSAFFGIDAITDQTTYYEYDVTYIDGQGGFTNNQKCLGSLRPDAGTMNEVTDLATDLGTTLRQMLFRVAKMGWAAYYDSQYTSGSPFNIDNTRVQLPNNGLGANTETSFLPYNTTALYDTVTDTIVAEVAGVAMELRIQFTAKPAAVSDEIMDIEFDIGGGGSIVIAEKTVTSPKGTDPFVVSWTTMIYGLSTFVANGCKIFINTPDEFDIYDIQIAIKQDYYPQV